MTDIEQRANIKASEAAIQRLITSAKEATSGKWYLQHDNISVHSDRTQLTVSLCHSLGHITLKAALTDDCSQLTLTRYHATAGGLQSSIPVGDAYTADNWNDAFFIDELQECIDNFIARCF